MNIISQLEAQQSKPQVAALRPGQTVRVHVKVVEGEKERTQVFEGTVIAMSGTSSRANFTVRKISYGVGVERIFPIHSPRIEKVEVMSQGKVRRAKLYYLRELSGKAARLTSTEK
jgi:large subunit ribosomal protein L19